MLQSSQWAILPFVLPYLSQMDKSIRFGLVADSHYADREPVNKRFYRDSIEKMKEFVHIMNRQKVDFVMHLGDFKDEGTDKNPRQTIRFLKDLETEYANFEGPRYHCVGNHDVDSITKEQFLKNIENTEIPNTESYYSFDVKGVHCIVLDANYSEDGKDHYFLEGSDWQDTNLTVEQLNWLQEDLQKTQKPALVFCHHLLFAYEKGGNRYHVNNYREVQKILEHSGRVCAVFQGHVHEELHKRIRGIHYITQNAMVDFEGIENNSFSIVEITNDSISIEGYKRVGNRNFLIRQ